ncbi:aspartate/glutamate racemase family protein [Salipiger abyssi]|uniref:aspartate/glutamate racemase family protein n=1 Tax=Salipiger abyssi TaxID=1250539 RepID=UPI001A8CB1D9|nr:aspartate/glutamate racemase family protein [Salipiger abyssi]MBN9888873.1 aspartate/glutamate racemase family protein [Salipiger abyssi]
MTRIVYLNPNSTAAMTESLVAVARRANPQADILGWTNAGGPPAIEGPQDGDAAVPGLLALLLEAVEAGADAIVIACFDDTGLAELRARAPCPVIGIGQSAYVSATLLGHRFSVITTLAVSVPVIEGNVAASGFGGNCVSVRASGLPVLTVEAGSEATRRRIAEEIGEAGRADGATAAILGCAGMAALRDDLAARSGLPLIDGVAASAQLAPALARMAG